MYEHKIEDYTFILYNIRVYDENQNNSTKCDSLLCKRGKCICINREQTGLLRLLLSSEDSIVMSFFEKQIIFKNLQNPLQDDDICKEYVPDDNYNALYHNWLSPENIKFVTQVAGSHFASNNQLLDVIKALPILYTTNSLHTFKERDSLLYLCRYAPCAKVYLFVLFRTIICKTIEECQNTPAPNRDFAKKLSLLLRRLKKVLTQNNELIKHTCIHNAEVYIDKWQLVNPVSQDPLSIPIIDALEAYRSELEGTSEIEADQGDWAKLHNLYLLLKKILKTAHISTMRLPKLPFGDYREDIFPNFKDVMDILDHVKKNPQKQQEIWKILSRIFESEEDIPDDELSVMKKIAYP